MRLTIPRVIFIAVGALLITSCDSNDEDMYTPPPEDTAADYLAGSLAHGIRSPIDNLDYAECFEPHPEFQLPDKCEP